MRTKKAFTAVAAVLAAVCMLLAVVFYGGETAPASAQSAAGRVQVKTVQSFHSISGYYLDVNLTGMDGSVSAQSGDAFVLRIDNNNTTANTVFSFKLNGAIMGGTSSAPTKVYTYHGTDYVASYSCGSYASGYIPGGADYDYFVIPASNFTGLGAVSAFAVSHRCAGGGAESNKQLDYNLYALYLINDFVGESALGVDSMTQLWAAAEDNFNVTVQNTSYTGSDYVEATYSSEEIVYDYSATAQAGEGGSVTFSSEQYNAGKSVSVIVKPEAGYELESLTVNGKDVTAQVTSGRYVAKNLSSDLVASATFRQAKTYFVENGAITSIYNTRLGTAYALWDAVNIMTAADMSTYSEYEYVGMTTETIGARVTNEAYLAVRIQNLDANWRTFYISVNGELNSASGIYYMVDRFGNVTAKTGTGIITEKFTRFSNATFNIGTVATEGFSGLIVIPLQSYASGSLEEIETVSVYTGAKNKSYARFNVGAVYVISDFDGENAPDVSEQDAIWKPAAENWSLYQNTSDYAEAQYLNKDDYAIRNITVSPYYDVFYMTLPQNMIGADGYVDFQALGVKGIAIDVENLNAYQTGFALRLAGYDNVSLTDTSKTLWQTSIAGGYMMKVIYDSGLVRTRAPAFLPYDETGTFSGTVYIPLSNTAFTNIGAAGNFPTKIQPVMRILFSKQDSDDSVYKANISNIRFVTDETPFETSVITMTGIGGVMTGEIGGRAIGTNSNNNVLCGTEVSFRLTPNRGYEFDYVTYTMGGVTTTAQLGSDGLFSVTVTGDLMVLFNCNEIGYAVTYMLEGGTNNANNLTTYYVSDGTVRLYEPTREGYVFKGWQDENGRIVEELDASAVKDVTLTAVWEAEAEGGAGKGALIGGLCALGAVVVIGGAVAAVLIVRRRKKQ